MDDKHPGEVEDALSPGGDPALTNDDAIWVKRASDAYDASTDYMESSVLNQWDTNIDNFRSRGATGEGAKQRKLFRPKTRSALRSHEAALAAALFTNNDLVSVEPSDKNNKVQALSAKLNKALLQHRLDKTIPWFQTAIGAYQDTLVYGIVISKTYWRHDTRESSEFVPAQDEYGELMRDDEGYVLGQKAPDEVIVDEPVIDILAPENFRFDPNADWRNPIKDSPYLIEQIPMYADEVIERMDKDEENSKTGDPEWRNYTLSQILAAGEDTTENKQTRITREGDREDPADTSQISEFRLVWVHFNIYRHEGVDLAYYTLGTTLLLSDPVPLAYIYKHGREVYTSGVSTIETHRNYPSSLSELGGNIQREINMLADQRYDNVRLTLNKRYFIKRQGNVDLAALANNRPGGGVFVDDPQNDVNVIQTPDVTSSSYAEQDRLNQDMDELMGTFSTSTVQSNRAMNETVGGMNLMATGANASQEYIMRTFIETWVEPVLRTLAKLEQYFETDETILGVAANKADIPAEAAQDNEIMDRLIQQDLNITVNVGLGNTNPEQKVQKLMMAVNTTANMPELAAKTAWPEVAKEIWAYAGFGDGERFIQGEEDGEQPQEGPPPEVQAKQMELQAKQQEAQADREHEMAMLQTRLQQEGQQSIAEMNTRRELELIKLSESKDMKLEELRAKVEIESSKDKTKRETEALRASLTSREFGIKLATGSGI